jgi:signal transduction histidine kinase
VAEERRQFERRRGERERSLLADRLITAEQEERRRLALELHDGPVQSLAGIALMLDAVLHAVDDGRLDEAKRVLESALERHRDTIRSLRDLSFNLEPVVLRDQGFVPAVHALADQLGTTHNVSLDLRLIDAEEIADRAQVALYQIVREALNQALGRQPSRISIFVSRQTDGGVDVLIEDDGTGERRRGTVQVLDERARTLGGEVSSFAQEGGGTRVRVHLPAQSTRR